MATCCGVCATLIVALMSVFVYFLVTTAPTEAYKPVDTEDIIAEHGKFLRLSNGRILEYFESGDITSGDTILFLHGYGQTGRFFKFYSKIFRKLKVRVLSPSYPGTGRSEFFPYEFKDFHKYAEELLNHVGTYKIYAVGVSNGGPHIAAVAAGLGDRIKDIAMIVPLSEKVPGNDPFKECPLMFRTAMTLLQLPYIGSFINNYVVRPSLRYDPIGHFEKLIPEEWAILRNEASKEEMENLANDQARGVVEGVDSLTHVMYLNSRPWGIDYGKVGENRRVFIYSCSRDTVCPSSGQEYLASRIPNSQLIKYGCSHMTSFSHLTEIIQKLMRHDE